MNEEADGLRLCPCGAWHKPGGTCLTAPARVLAKRTEPRLDIDGLSFKVNQQADRLADLEARVERLQKSRKLAGE